MMTLERYLDRIWQRALKQLKTDHGPILIAEHANAPRAVVAMPWRSTDEKIAMLEIASRALKESDAYRYAVVCEAWVVALEHKPGDPVPDIIPSQHADRFTVLQVTAVDRSPRRALMRAGKIIGEGNKRHVVDVQTLTDGFGRLSELFPQTATAH